MASGRSASPSVFLVVDPVQDYEESLQVWGVFGSLPAAKHAARALRTRHLSAYQQERLTEVQHWQGARRLATWTFWPPGEHTRTGWHQGRAPAV